MGQVSQEELLINICTRVMRLARGNMEFSEMDTLITVLYKRIKDLMVIEEELEREAFYMSSNVLAVCCTTALKTRQVSANNITRH